MILYNTKTRKKEEFIPLKAGKVSIYACGPTVYNYFHIGNARAFVFFDVVHRYFEYQGKEVTYVQNITDIDDKIIAQAVEEGISFSDVAAKYTLAFHQDCAALGIKPPTVQPLATHVMEEILSTIEILVSKGYAYEANGDVYFDTTSLPSYGSLSGKKTEEQQTGARVAENLYKRNPTDFTLWKKSKPGEPVWQSPWGEGRPGWHTECVVMSQKYLGETFDIHGGGIDLVFPHHENELAQAMALTGKPLANYWMHNGFLNIEGEKMSKSLNNFFTARDILKEYDAEAIRFFFLSKHYRSPIDFNRELIEESKRAVANFYSALKSVDYLSLRDSIGLPDYHQSAEMQVIEEEFIASMEDDFNTARAIAALFELSKRAKNTSSNLQDRQVAALLLVHLGSVLGFFQNIDERLAERKADLSSELVELILSYRKEARDRKDWAMSDKIRDDLAKHGIGIKDTPDGCTWEIKETK
ncbi:MAG: cysteine--tRNA ligase [Candidatus Cloacimonetes bacterium]|nr:cysteine--tRNA ligase [Candidatus Cloacimonadota bacterium]